MKKSIVSFLFVLAALNSFAQYDIVTNNNDTIETCTGTLASGSIVIGETYSVTVCSDDLINTHISVYITDYSLSSGSSLCVYDGASTDAPLLECKHSVIPSGSWLFQATSNNVSGCLTFVFTTDMQPANWNGDISCNFVCLPRTVEITSSLPLFNDEGFIDVCWDEINNQSFEVDFTAASTYPDVNYELDDDHVSYMWRIQDDILIEETESNSLTYNFLMRKGYTVSVSTIDMYGCESNNYINKKVRVSLPPNYEGIATPAQICLGSETALCSSYTEATWTSEIIAEDIMISNDIVPIPDNPPECVESYIFIADFEPGQIIANIDDLHCISMQLEHSYLGDITIFIRCPNGQEMQIQTQGGAGINLGIPPDTGYLYTITPYADLTMGEAASDMETTLPAGEYASYQSFSSLIGCPINGTWVLRICDNWSADDGTLFGWGLSFNAEDCPYTWSYQAQYEEIEWTGPLGSEFFSSQYDDCVTATCNDTDNNLVDSYEVFNFSMTDNLGCEYVFPLEVLVLNINHIDCLGINIDSVTNNIEYSNNIYPNPATNIIYLENAKDIKIYDISSKLVMTVDMADNKHGIDISKLSIGTYVLEGYFDGALKNLKFIKK